MFESFEDYKDYGIVMVVLLSVISIAISGMWFALIYFVLDSVHTAFLSVDCVIDGNVLVSSCQELFHIFTLKRRIHSFSIRIVTMEFPFTINSRQLAQSISKLVDTTFGFALL
jgi:hypothetical protein